MLLCFLLPLFFCETTGLSLTTTWPTNYSLMGVSPSRVEGLSIALSSVSEWLSPLQVTAMPDYPVAAGQTVNLHCSTFAVPNFINWSWQHLENLTWQVVGSGRDLALTEPKQSGLYRCRAETQLSQRVSRNLTVFIIGVQPTASENLGVAAFVLSLLAVMTTLAILCWLLYQRLGDTLTTSITTAKSFPGPEKGSFPQTESNGDMYMNYTSTNRAYTDLDPTHMTGDNVYSSLS